MAKILVSGGTGYIGSHTIVELIENGFDIISVDNFCNSHLESLYGIEKITSQKIKNYKVDITDKRAISDVFQKHKDIVGIIHFAAVKSVGESVQKPLFYFKNNILSLINILECGLEANIQSFIFSSSCSVYGQPKELPVNEQTLWQKAESPYGRSKQMGEQILEDLSKTDLFPIISLRYFNPAGAHASGWIGESSRVKSSNLVPVIMETASKKRKEMLVHGSNYPTRDGSCIRDYVHVMDVARAHTLALQYHLKNSNSKPYDVFNLGMGKGVSVLEAINAFNKISGMALNFSIGPRRPGDVASVYSDYSKASKVLQWEPENSIEDIMRSAWKWELNKKY